MKGRILNTSTGAILTSVVVVLWVMLASVPKTSAIPAFSRKYQTSGTTCHSNYPELNDFGLAFKKNSFKFPKDDETFVKEPPVLLGSKAQKEAFPEAVYPGEIPGFLPIAFRYSGNFNWNASQPKPVCLCLPKMLSGANAFKISDLQEAEKGSIASQAIRMDNVTLRRNRWTEFLRTTGRS
jgi:hypothetical protein